MNNVNDLEWKKAAMEPQPSKNEVERAFMDQAYAFIQNKAGRLLSDPHRLGFEIVYKNDANTRLVGIFAFRAEARLLYAPCFFINGAVKGTDLLYDQSRKMFCPLTEDWVEYKLETSSSAQGSGYKNDAQMRRSMDVRKLMIPPSNRGFFEKGAKIELPIADVLVEMSKTATLGPILRQFMLEDGGLGALNHIEKAAASSMEFAQALATLDGDDFAPDGLVDLQAPTVEKSADARGDLYVITEVCDMLKAARVEEFAKRGYDFSDERKDTTTVEVNDIELQNVDKTGIYHVLCVDGSVEAAFCVKGAKRIYPGEKCSPECGVNISASSDVDVIYKDGTVTNTHEVVYGELKGDETDWEAEGVAKLKPTKGSYYVLYCPKANVHSHVYVRASRTVGDQTVYTLADAADDNAATVELVINPEQEESFVGDTWHACECVWVKFKVKSGSSWGQPTRGKSLGDALTLDRFLYTNDMIPAELRCEEKSAGQRYTLSLPHILETFDMAEPNMAVKLARDLGIQGDTALTLIDAATALGSIKFWMPKADLEKAGAMRLMDDPDFSREFDSDFGVPVDPGTATRLTVQDPQEPFPGQRIGDAVKPEGGSNSETMSLDEIMSQAPEQLAQLAQMRGLSNVFEHGMVGALTKTFNVVTMIDRYTPELEKALDAIGRCLFLFFWKPGEFQDAYGVDDMQNLEDELINAFEGMGSLTLSLLRRSSQTKTEMVTGSGASA